MCRRRIHALSCRLLDPTPCARPHPPRPRPTRAEIARRHFERAHLDSGLRQPARVPLQPGAVGDREHRPAAHAALALRPDLPPPRQARRAHRPPARAPPRRPLRRAPERWRGSCRSPQRRRGDGDKCRGAGGRGHAHRAAHAHRVYLVRCAPLRPAAALLSRDVACAARLAVPPAAALRSPPSPTPPLPFPPYSAAPRSYARQNCHPRLSDEASDELAKAYVEMRRVGASRKTISATPRQLESLIRLVSFPRPALNVPCLRRRELRDLARDASCCAFPLLVLRAAAPWPARPIVASAHAPLTCSVLPSSPSHCSPVGGACAPAPPPHRGEGGRRRGRAAHARRHAAVGDRPAHGHDRYGPHRHRPLRRGKRPAGQGPHAQPGRAAHASCCGARRLRGRAA